MSDMYFEPEEWEGHDPSWVAPPAEGRYKIHTMHLPKDPTERELPMSTTQEILNEACKPLRERVTELSDHRSEEHTTELQSPM